SRRSRSRLPASLSPYTPSGDATMILCGSTLQKRGFSRPAAEATPPPQTPASPQPASQTATETAPTAPLTAITVVDVVAKLEGLGASHAQKLNWKVSIVDLLKLLNLDSSFAARKELATELGCPADKMGDSAQMNMWLHKTVLQKLADNGGNIPKELLG